MKRTLGRTVQLKGGDLKRTLRRTVLLKGSDIKRTSRETALLKGRNTRTIQLLLKHLKGVGIGMTPLSDWLNVLRGTAGGHITTTTTQRYVMACCINIKLSCACNICTHSRAALLPRLVGLVTLLPDQMR